MKNYKSSPNTNFFTYSIIFVVAAACLVIGYMFGTKHVNQSLLRIAASEQKAIESCQNAVTALNTQSDSCMEAYKTLRGCVGDKTCDLQTEAIKMQQLEQLRIKSEDTLNTESEIIRKIHEELKTHSR